MFGRRIFPDARTDALARAELLAALPASHDFLIGAARSAGEIMRQQMVLNAVHDAGEQWAAEAGNAAALRAYTEARAEAQTVSAYRAIGRQAETWVPLLRIVFECLYVGAFPMAVLLMLTPAGGAIFRSYVTGLVWLQSWGPLYAVLHRISMGEAAERMQAAALMPGGDIGISLVAQAGIRAVASDVAVMSGFRLAVAALLLGDEAGRAVGHPAQGGGLALDADPGGPAGVVAGAGSLAAALALGRSVGRLAALGAVATGAPLGIAPAVGFQPRPRVTLPPLFADRGAGFAIRFPAGRGSSAGDAQSGGAAFAIAVALGPPPVLTARLAHCPALGGRGVAATDADAGGPAGLAAPAAALAVGAALGLGIASAIRDPPGLGPGVASAVADAVALGAGLAERALGARRLSAALRADPGGLALGVLPAVALALILLRPLAIAPRLALGAEPGGAGAVGGAALLQARLAERALRRGLGLAALEAEPRRAALLGALVEAFAIAPPFPGDVAASHDGLPPADSEMDGRGSASGHSAAAPASGQTLALGGEGRADADGCGTAARNGRGGSAGGGQREDWGVTAPPGGCRGSSPGAGPAPVRRLRSCAAWGRCRREGYPPRSRRRT